MARRIHVVVTCTKRKTRPVPPELAYRNLPRGTLSERVDAWRERLACSASSPIPASELYAGDHWSVVRSLAVNRKSISVWVASAGYGLLKFHSPVRPYSATFSATHLDSVTKGNRDVPPTEAARRWWEETACRPPFGEPYPQSLAQLVEDFPKDLFVVAASDVYLGALAGDLLEARGRLTAADRLAIISAGCRRLDGLEGYLLPCDARLQTLVGGARRSINVRLLRHALSECRGDPSLPVLRRLFDAWLAEATPLNAPKRIAMADNDVRRFVHEALVAEPCIRVTPLLRRLRDGGHACEQSRFKAIFREVEARLQR